MPNIYWRQIRDIIDEPKHLTGSLNVSGSVDVIGELTINGEDVATTIGAFTGSVQAGLGLGANTIGDAIELYLDTGSAHFLDAVEASGLFRQTGSFWSTTNNIQITGSLQVTDNFSVGLLEDPGFRAETGGTLQLKAQDTTPSPVSGGLFYSSSDAFYFGFEN